MIISKGSRGHQIRKWSLIPNEDPSVANCELQLYSMLCMETDRNCVSEAQNSRPYWIPDGALCWQGQVEVRTLKGSLVLPRHQSLSLLVSPTHLSIPFPRPLLTSSCTAILNEPLSLLPPFQLITLSQRGPLAWHRVTAAHFWGEPPTGRATGIASLPSRWTWLQLARWGGNIEMAIIFTLRSVSFLLDLENVCNLNMDMMT